MSHASVNFLFPDGSQMYGEYDGTADVMMPEAFHTLEEMETKWRNHDWSKKCNQPDKCLKELCTVVNHYYGSGCEWKGEVCKTCGLYFGPANDWDRE
ncbi:hypothetical protein NIES4103_26660 [Nostoc sp. NIES-4103]|nr:hypothetical protein NIES4103_26660 [Nostoc sp. NIES-4103]